MKTVFYRPFPAVLKSTSVKALVVFLLCIQLGFSPLYGDTVIDADTTIDNGGAVVSGNGGRGIFVNSGNVTISDTTFVNFNTKGGDGSGGGAGMGGVIFVNDGAAITLNNVNLYGNTATGGRGGVGTTGGNLNGFTSAITGTTSNGSTGANGESGSSADAYLNGGDGRDGYNGDRGGNATNGVGGAGGSGGNGSDGSTVTLDNASAAFDIAKSAFDAAGDQTQAGLYTAISATFTSLAASAAAGANAGGPTTVNLAPSFTALAGQYASLAAEAQGSVVQAAIDATFESAKLVALETTTFELGLKGNGGSGGAAGDGGDGSFGFGGGAGGQGGNGGDAANGVGGLSAAIGGAAGDGGAGGNGGFGAGGGRGGNVGSIGSDGDNADHAGDYGSGGSGGTAGFGGGVGADGDDHPDAPTQGGAGGSGMGGAIFIREGGSVTITGNATFAGNNAKGGQGQILDNVPGDSGIGIGTDIFMMKGSSLTLDAGEGNVIRFSDSSGASIADNSFASMDSAGGSSPIATGEGAGLEVRSGLVIFENENVYTGQTLISGGVLQAQDGEGIATNSNINFAGGVLQSHGTFTRFTGTQSDRVQWTGSGGFAAAGGDLTVNLNYGTELTWGQDSFVPDGSALIFGSTTATDDVHFLNDIDLGGGTRTVLVKANDDNSDYAYLDGDLSNGGLVVGDADHDGILVLTGENTYAGGTTIDNGSLVIGNGGSLNANGAVSVNSDGTLDISISGDQAIGNLDGAGTVSLGAGTLTINQAGNTTFSGVLQDGGLNGGTGGNVVKNLGGTLTLSGANTYTGNTDLNAGTIILDGSLESAQVTIASGSTLENNAGGFASGSTIINNGLLQQDSDDTIKKLVNTGTIDNSASTLTAEIYELNNGSVINVNLGTGEITSNGTVAVNGTANAEKLTVGSGTTTLGSAERLNDAIVVQIDSGANLALGGDEKIGVLNGAGDLQNHGGLLTVNSGSFAGVVSGTGGLTKVSDGTLQLTGANTYTGSTEIDDGTLELSGGGSLAGNVINIAVGATLDDLNGGLASTATVTNDGTFNIGGVDDTITELINTGTVNGSAKLTAANYRLNSGSVVNANLGTGIVDSNGTVALNGTSDAETVNVQTGTMTLGSAERLDDETDLTVSGGAKLVLGGEETIGTLDGAGTVDNAGGHLTADDGIFSGVIEGSGGLTKTSSGTLELSGVNTYTGQTNVGEGTLNLTGSLAGEKIDISSGALLIDENAGLTDDADVNANGTFRLGSDEKIDQLTGSGSVELAANRLTVNSGSFAGVVSGTGGLDKASSGTLTLSGANTYTGSTNIDEGTVDLTGSLASGDVTVDNGARLNSRSGGLAATSTLNNDGTVDLGGTDDTVGTYNSSGTLLGTGTLTATNYNLNDGSNAEANLGAGTIHTTGAVSLGGTSAAETVNVAAGSVLSLAGKGEQLNDAAEANIDGTLELLGGDETIRLLNGNGTIEAGKFDLIVTEGGNFGGTLNATQLVSTGGVIQLKTGAVLNTGSVVSGTGGGFNLANGTTINSTHIIVETGSTITVDDGATLGSSGNLLVQNGGELDVSDGATVGANTIEVQGGGVLDLHDPYNLSYGLLTGNGFVNTNGGTFVNDRGETVGGFLSFSDGFVNFGDFAPGNSPGLVVIHGDFTERANHFSEISTTTPVTGHDQIRVGGDIHLKSSSQLVVQTYKGATPERGDVYQILSDLRGRPVRVNGTFGKVRFDADGAKGRGKPVDNAAVVFDVNTGQVVATGLNESDSEFADLGENHNQRTAAAALFDVAQVGDNQIDTSDPLVGVAARNVIDSSNVASDQLSRLVPVYLGSLADYAMGGDASMSSLVRSRVSPLKHTDSRGGFAGYNRFRMTSNDDVEIDRNDGYVGADHVFENGIRLGALAHFNSGDVGHAYGSGEADGFGGQAYAEGSINARTQVLANIGGSSTDFALRRKTQFGTSIGDTDVSSFNTSLGARYLLKESEVFSLMPHFILGYESASVEEFVERGTLDALHNSGYDSSRLHAEIGASAVWTKELNGRDFAFELTAGLRQDFSSDEDELQATLVNDTRLSYPVRFAPDDETYFNVRTNASYQIFEAGTVYTGFEGLFGGDEAITNLNAGFGYSF